MAEREMGTPVSFRTGDVTLAADAFGRPDDPPVLLLHGGGQTRHAWHGSAARLAERGWYAITLDLRGHGDSDWSPDGIYTAERFAEDVLSVASQLSQPPAFVGASLGGTTCLLAVGESEEPVASALVLVDVAPRIEDAGVERIRSFMLSGTSGFDSLEDAAEAVAAYNPHRPRPKDLSGLKKNLRQHDDGRWYWHWDPRFMIPDHATAIDGLARERYVPEARLVAAAQRVTVPTLLVRGASSDLLSEEGAQHLLSLLPHARYADVAGAGHMVAGDRNDAFNEAVVSFLETEVRPVLD